MRNPAYGYGFSKNNIRRNRFYKTRICLLGGEPGLIKKSDEIINEIKHENSIPSFIRNNLVRKFIHILEDPDIIYIEHSITFTKKIENFVTGRRF